MGPAAGSAGPKARGKPPTAPPGAKPEGLKAGQPGRNASIRPLTNQSHRIQVLTSVVQSITKLKPRWDVHLPDAGNGAGSLPRVPRPLTAGPSGIAVLPRLSGWSARRGSYRLSLAPPLCFQGTGCLSPLLSPSPIWPHRH